MSSHHVEQAARIIYQCRHPNGDPIGGTFNGPSWVELEMRDARAVAEMLDRAGLLAPAPLHEEWGSISMASGAVFRAPTLSAALDRTPAGGQVARRYVTDWEPADGDRGDQP